MRQGSAHHAGVRNAVECVKRGVKRVCESAAHCAPFNAAARERGSGALAVNCKYNHIYSIIIKQYKYSVIHTQKLT